MSQENSYELKLKLLFSDLRRRDYFVFYDSGATTPLCPLRAAATLLGALKVE